MVLFEHQTFPVVIDKTLRSSGAQVAAKSLNKTVICGRLGLHGLFFTGRFEKILIVNTVE